MQHQVNESENIIPEPLSGKYKKSFAYKTLANRLPVIITKLIDYVSRNRRQIPLELNVSHAELDAAEKEAKEIVRELVKLKHDLQTNKDIESLTSTLPDTQAWNSYLDVLKKKEEVICSEKPRYFNVSWLYAECYFYRKIREIFWESKYFKNYDYFSSDKKKSFLGSMGIANALGKLLSDILHSSPEKIANYKDEWFHSFILSSLMGNKFDLSLSCGGEIKSVNSDTKELEKTIIVNEINLLWTYVQKLALKQFQNKRRIDVVLDNSGCELLTDLCLIEFLHVSQLFPKHETQVYFHVKKMPWFVSDTMKCDFDCLFGYIKESGQKSAELMNIIGIFEQNLAQKYWLIEENDFWTLPHDYAQMPRVAPELCRELYKSDLIIFKGDLNYRKLVGDLQWKPTTRFGRALREFQPPTGVCALRTIKADVVVGIHDPLMLQRIHSFPQDWMETGNYAVVHFLSNCTI